jgi:lipopolysaccharide transport system permease protein
VSWIEPGPSIASRIANLRVSWTNGTGCRQRTHLRSIDLDAQTVVEPTELAGLEWPVERVIEPAKRRLKLRQLPSYAPIVRVLAARDLKVKYKQSMLGPLWLVFQPLALFGAFLVAFKGLAGVQSAGVSYVPFALVGLSVWSFFQAAMTIGTASVLTNNSYVRYTPCPRPAFPIAAVIASLPAFGITFVGALIATVVNGALSPRVLLLPAALLWLVLLTLGAVAVLSSIAVRYRDINSALPFLLQVGVFLAPVGYPLSELSPAVRALVDLNPVTGVIEASRWMMLSGYHCSAAPIVLSLAVTALLVAGGWRLFTRLETTMADDI